MQESVIILTFQSSMFGLPPISGLSIERLKTFCAIVEAGSIVGAARGDPTRQSQYSRQVSELEKFFGTYLFRRVGKSLVLTEEGKRVALAARAFFRAVGDIAASVAGANERVTLGASQSVLRWQVLPRLMEISGNTEKFVLEMRTFSTDETVRALHDGTIDVAVAREDALAESDPKLDGGILEYRLVVARRLLPGKSAAGFQLLKTIPFGILAGEGQLVKQIHALAREGGWEINVRLKAENFTLLFEALDHVDLAVFLPRPAAEALSKERYAIIELPHVEKLSRKLAVTFNPKAAEFRESVRKVAQRISRILSKKISGT